MCRDLRAFHGVEFSSEDLLRVKDLTFRNSGHAMVNIVQRDKSWRGKQLRQASQLFQGLIVVFVFLSPVKKQQYTFESQGSKILP